MEADYCRVIWGVKSVVLAKSHTELLRNVKIPVLIFISSLSLRKKILEVNVGFTYKMVTPKIQIYWFALLANHDLFKICFFFLIFLKPKSKEVI